MNKSLLSIVAAECLGACANEPDLDERIKKAMKPVANGHWMGAAINDDLCFRGAVAAVLMNELTTEGEKARIKYTLDQMRSVAAMISGVPVDVEAALDNPDEIEPVQLIKFWQDAKDTA